MHRLYWIALAITILLAACSGGKGVLKPLDSDSGQAGIIASQPQLVTFSELQDDPEAYKDKLVRVTGSFFHLPNPKCLIASGPKTSWSLISENLRLDAIGFEQSLQLVRPETVLTVDGIFRKYDGPLGCGKRPPNGVAWFLETSQIVQPNPLARVIGTVEIGSPPLLPPLIGSPTPPGTVPVDPTGMPPIGASPTGPGTIPTATPTTLATAVQTGTSTAVATAGTIIPTVTPSPNSTTINPTTTGTPSVTPTANPGTGTAIPTSTVPQTPGPTQPPLSTSTPGGYPVPSTPTPTSSPTAYPGQ